MLVVMPAKKIATKPTPKKKIAPRAARPAGRKAGALLDAAAHESFIERGYALIRGVVPPELVAAAVKALEAPAPAGAPKKRFDIPEVAACLTPDVQRAVEELAGGPCTITRRFRDMARRHEPGTPPQAPVSHTDNAHPVVMPDGFSVGAFIFLTRGTPGSGCFVVFPGSHKEYRRRLALDADSLRLLDNVTHENGKSEEVLVEPGDLLLFHHLLGHSGSTNRLSPVTRHALLGWLHADGRVAPGAKPLEEMSTLEKANSARWFESRGAPAFPRFSGRAAERALREGAPFARGLRTHALLRFGGAARCFYADAAAPGLLRVAASADGADWKVSDVKDFGVRALATLHVHRQADEILLFAGLSGGGVEVLQSRDLKEWKRLFVLDGRRFAFAHETFVSPENREAGYDMIFSADEKNPSALLRRRGSGWASGGTWKAESAAGGVRGELVDAEAWPVLGDRLFALAADARLPGAKATSLRVVRSESGESYDGASEALAAPSGARALRVYDRARDYWLAGYLAPGEGGDRLFWGAVDWGVGAPALRPLADARALDEALGVVGLI